MLRCYHQVKGNFITSLPMLGLYCYNCFPPPNPVGTNKWMWLLHGKLPLGSVLVIDSHVSFISFTNSIGFPLLASCYVHLKNLLGIFITFAPTIFILSFIYNISMGMLLYGTSISLLHMISRIIFSPCILTVGVLIPIIHASVRVVSANHTAMNLLIMVAEESQTRERKTWPHTTMNLPLRIDYISSFFVFNSSFFVWVFLCKEEGLGPSFFQVGMGRGII